MIKKIYKQYKIGQIEKALQNNPDLLKLFKEVLEMPKEDIATLTGLLRNYNGK